MVARLFGFIFYIVFSLSAWADCPAKFERLGRFALHVLESKSGECFLSVSDQSAAGLPDLIYRNYIFTSDGLFMVFVSGGSGPESRETGSRTYHVFPRGQPRYYRDPSGNLRVVTSIANEFIFSDRSGDLIGATNMKLQIDPKVHLDNQGGVEILESALTILDSGWQLGGMANSHFDRESIFRRKGLPDCTFKNGKLFKLVNGDNVRLRATTDAELNEFLAANCPF